MCALNSSVPVLTFMTLIYILFSSEGMTEPDNPIVMTAAICAVVVVIMVVVGLLCRCRKGRQTGKETREDRFVTIELFYTYLHFCL